MPPYLLARRLNGLPDLLVRLKCCIGWDLHQRLTNTPFKFIAAGDNVDVESIVFPALDYNPGVFVVVGTPHLGNGCRVIPSDLFDRRIELRTQSKPRIIWTLSTGTGHKTCSHSPVAAVDC